MIPVIFGMFVLGLLLGAAVAGLESVYEAISKDDKDEVYAKVLLLFTYGVKCLVFILIGPVLLPGLLLGIVYRVVKNICGEPFDNLINYVLGKKEEASE